MPPLFLVALTAADVPSAILTVLLSLAGSTVAFSWLARGFWAKQVTPLVQEEIKKYQIDPVNTKSQKDGAIADVTVWMDQRPQREARLKEIEDALSNDDVKRKVDKLIHEKIDNEIKRSDGLIAKEVDSVVQRNLAGLREEIQKVGAFLREDAQMKAQLLQRMSRLEGSVSMFQGSRVASSGDSTSHMPAVKDPSKP